MEYLVSVIVPVYNSEKYILETLESVKRQTLGFENIQLIIVDDCSTDYSFQTVKEWAAGCSNVVLTQTDTNSGSPALPRNIGLDLAVAPYIMFLDNDDMYTDSACKVLYDTALNTGADIVSGDSELMESDIRFTEEEKTRLLWHTETIQAGEYSLKEELGDWIVPFLNNHWCKIYKREIIEKNKIRSLPGEIWEDILFLFLYLSVSEKCVYIKKPIVQYRARKESLSHVQGEAFYCSIPKSMNYGKERADELGTTDQYLSFVNYGFGIVEYYLDELLSNNKIDKEALERCVLAWAKPFEYCGSGNFQLHSAYGRILSDDMKRNEPQQAVFHFFELKRLYLQRKEELDEIFNSKTYKLAQLIGKIVRHR